MFASSTHLANGLPVGPTLGGLHVRNVFLAASALTLIAAPAFAQDQSPDVYVNLGYSVAQLSFEEVLVPGDSYDFDIGSATARVGVNLHPNFAVEGEASIGVDDDTQRIGMTDVTIENEWDAAIYGVGIVPLGEQFKIFARVGFGHTEARVSSGGFGLSADGNSWNYGVGAQFMIDDKNGFRADWTRRDFTEDGGEIDAYGVSFVRHF